MERAPKNRRVRRRSPLHSVSREERLAAKHTKIQLSYDKIDLTDRQLLEAILTARRKNIPGRTERMVQNYKRRLIAEELIDTFAERELLYSLYDQEFPTTKRGDRLVDVFWDNRRKPDVLELRKYENGELLRIIEGEVPWSKLSPLKRRRKTPEEVIARLRNRNSPKKD